MVKTNRASRSDIDVSAFMPFGLGMVSLVRSELQASRFIHLGSGAVLGTGRSKHCRADGRAESQRRAGQRFGRAAIENCMSLSGIKHGE